MLVCLVFLTQVGNWWIKLEIQCQMLKFKSLVDPAVLASWPFKLQSVQEVNHYPVVSRAFPPCRQATSMKKIDRCETSKWNSFLYILSTLTSSKLDYCSWRRLLVASKGLFWTTSWQKNTRGGSKALFLSWLTKWINLSSNPSDKFLIYCIQPNYLLKKLSPR